MFDIFKHYIFLLLSLHIASLVLPTTLMCLSLFPTLSEPFQGQKQKSQTCIPKRGDCFVVQLSRRVQKVLEINTSPLILITYSTARATKGNMNPVGEGRNYPLQALSNPTMTLYKTSTIVQQLVKEHVETTLTQ